MPGARPESECRSHAWYSPCVSVWRPADGGDPFGDMQRLQVLDEQLAVATVNAILALHFVLLVPERSREPCAEVEERLRPFLVADLSLSLGDGQLQMHQVKIAYLNDRH